VQANVLSIENLAITYTTRRGDVKAVRDVSLQIDQGEAVALVGESGCGKSTVAFATLGYLESNARIASGRVLFKGEDLLTMTQKRLESLRGREIAMVYQDPMTTLNPSFRIGDQLMEVLIHHERLSSQAARARSVEMLEKMSLPDAASVMERYPHQISGGQQQRVVIAMTLLCRPALVVMDEPTTALDVTVEAAILDHVRMLRSEFNTAILYITHNLGVVARFCDRVSVMYAGELVESAPVEEIFLEPRHPYSRGLISCVPKMGACKDTERLNSIEGQIWPAYMRPPGCIFEPRCRFSEEKCRGVHPELEHSENRRAVRCFRWQELEECGCFSAEPALAAEPFARSSNASPERGCEPTEGALLKVSNLRTHYTQRSGSMLKGKQRQLVKAVDEVSFTMDPHRVVGVVGESGCGKSTLARTIAGLVVPTAGKIEFMGLDVTKVVEKRERRAVRELQMVFQNPDSSLNPTKTIEQIISRPLQLAGKSAGRSTRDGAVRLLEAVNLNDSYLQRKPRQLSGGEKQRVAIACALASQPDLLVCDEPVSALDVSVQCSVLNTLLEIQSTFGTSLLFISHDLSVIRYLCDTVVVMYLGKICEIGPAANFFVPPYHPYTEALLSAIPIPDPRIQQARIRLAGTPPSALEPPSGCRFHTRCARKMGAICETLEPPGRTPCDGYTIYCHIPLEELQQVSQVLQLNG
jgi:peptide/nickel transport system ATP-binding protein